MAVESRHVADVGRSSTRPGADDAASAADGGNRRRADARIATLEVERDTVLVERDTARTERDLIREKHDAARAEIEKLRLLIRQLQRGQFGRRSETLDPDQLQLGLEDLEQTVAAAEAAQEEAAARNSTPRPPRVRRRNLGALPAHLPRVEVLVDVEDKSCPCCGGACTRSARTRARCSTSSPPSCG
jgi:hypothetical protein